MRNDTHQGKERHECPLGTFITQTIIYFRERSGRVEAPSDTRLRTNSRFFRIATFGRKGIRRNVMCQELNEIKNGKTIHLNVEVRIS
jgi:hypothetical protein